LSESISAQLPATPKWHRPPDSGYYVPEALSTCANVLIRVDRQTRNLAQKYSGPYPVVDRKPKHFIIRRENCLESVSIDRLKPVVD
ncbi:Hypothetical predicted protein, partial [Paramuricea clavata]